MTWTYQEVLNLFFILFFTIHNTTEHGLTHQNETQFPPQSVSPIRKLPQTSYLYPSEGRQTENHNQRKLIKLITWTTALSNSMKLWAMPCRATQDGQVMVESSDKTWSTGEGNGKTLQYSCLENPMSSMKRKKGRTLKDELPRSVGAQYAAGDQWRNNSRKNEETEPKWKQLPAVDVTGDGSKVRCCKEQYCIRKAMTSLDSILKSRDITLPAKVCLVKAMIFLVVMYGY